MPSVNRQTHRSKAPGGIAARLHEWRTEQGLSRAQLAERAGVSARTVSRVELGGSVSADTAARLEWALDLEQGEIAPDWDLPRNPHDPGYGHKVRARRRALGLSLEALAAKVGVSASALSRFECCLSMPRGWLAEWTDRYGTRRDAIVCEPLAAALGFSDARELHRFCVASDVGAWAVEGDRRSGLWHDPAWTARERRVLGNAADHGPPAGPLAVA